MAVHPGLKTGHSFVERSRGLFPSGKVGLGVLEVVAMTGLAVLLLLACGWVGVVSRHSLLGDGGRSFSSLRGASIRGSSHGDLQV